VIAPENGRKIVRALEVVQLTGEPFTTALPSYDAAAYDAIYVGVDLDTSILDRRVAARVEVMFDSGLEAEVRGLEAAGLRDGITASRALGYAQLLAVIDGAMDLATARSETARATRRFVRRQRSWFRRDPRINWLDGAADPVSNAVALARV
jgi:tRNA dimethylallyltransferase